MPRLVEMLVKTAKAGRLSEIDFRDKTIANRFDCGALFTEMYGFEEFAHCRKDRQYVPQVMREAAGAVSLQQFSNITGQIVFSRVLDAYESEDFVFTNLIPKIPTPFQDGERLPGFTGLATSTQEVGEGKPAHIVGIGEDFIQTPACTKRKLILPLTREAIFGDRTGQLLSRVAPAVGEALGIEQEENAIDAVIDENQTRHRYNWKNGGAVATFQTSTPWINDSASTPLVDENSVNTLETLLGNMVDPFTGKPIKVVAKHIVAYHGLNKTVDRIVSATNLRVGTYPTSGTASVVMEAPRSVNLTPVQSRYLAARLATDTHWFIGDIAKAVNYMMNWDLELREADANHPLNFSNDIVQQYSASRKGEYVVVQPRALVRGKA